MAEEEVNYASVVFKANKPRSEAQKEEETVYAEVTAQNESTEQTPDTHAGLLPDKEADSRRRHYQQLACCFGALSVILLLGIIGVCVYLTLIDESDKNELSELRKRQTTLLADNRNLTDFNNKLRSDHENLWRDHDNLTQAYAVLESNITNLTAKNQNLTRSIEGLETQNQQLQTQNQQLQTEKNSLTEQLQNMEANGNELNISRAQWSIEAYCPKQDNMKRDCAPCQPGWLDDQSSCYGVINPDSPGQKTWEEAQGACRGKISDLVVVTTAAEKQYVSDHSWGSSGTDGYWIGLRVVGGKWKWVDGSDLTDQSWMQQPATDGECAISVEAKGWKSVSCNNNNRWICEKKALTI